MCSRKEHLKLCFNNILWIDCNCGLLGCNGKEYEGMMWGNLNYKITTEEWDNQTASVNETVLIKRQVTTYDVHWLR